MRKNLNNNKGLTLVEILVSMVILSIVIFSFLNFFGFSFGNIFSMGIKDRAMTDVSEAMESLYAKQNEFDGLTKSQVQNFLTQNFNGVEKLNENALFENTTTDEFRFFIQEINPFDEEEENDKPGLKVVIVSFYQSGEKNVVLTSFFRGRD